MALLSMRAAQFLGVIIAPFRVGVHSLSLIVIACLAITTAPCPAAAEPSHETVVEASGHGGIGGDQQPERPAADGRNCFTCPCHVAFAIPDTGCVEAQAIIPDTWSATAVRALYEDAVYATFRPPKTQRT